MATLECPTTRGAARRATWSRSSRSSSPRTPRTRTSARSSSASCSRPRTASPSTSRAATAAGSPRSTTSAKDPFFDKAKARGRRGGLPHPARDQALHGAERQSSTTTIRPTPRSTPRTFGGRRSPADQRGNGQPSSAADEAIGRMKTIFKQLEVEALGQEHCAACPAGTGAAPRLGRGPRPEASVANGAVRAGMATGVTGLSSRSRLGGGGSARAEPPEPLRVPVLPAPHRALPGIRRLPALLRGHPGPGPVYLRGLFSDPVFVQTVVNTVIFVGVAVNLKMFLPSSSRVSSRPTTTARGSSRRLPPPVGDPRLPGILSFRWMLSSSGGS